MAQLAIGAAGGALGVATGLFTFGAGFAIFGTLAGMMLNHPHQPNPTFKAMGSVWGDTWPLVYNSFRVPGRLIQASDITRHHTGITKSGKLSHGLISNVMQSKEPATFTQTFAVGLCEGPRVIGRIWADNQVIYDPRPITAPPSWSANTVYGAGDIVRPTAGGSWQFTASIDGESGSSEPSWNNATNSATIDGSQVWIGSAYTVRKYVGQTYDYIMRIYPGDESQLPDAALEEFSGTGNQPAYRGLCYLVFENFDLAKTGNRIPNIEAEIFTVSGGSPATTTLADIAADISDRIGLSPSDYDYSALAGVTPRGVALLDRATARSFLEGMQPAFWYDLTDIGDKIVGSLRSSSSILLTIPESKLAAGADPTTIVDKISTMRGNDLEIPKDLSVSYYDFAHDYQQGSQPAKRSSVTQYSSGRNSITLPVVMTPGEAANAATRSLYLLWIGRAQKKLSVPLDYLKLTPSDVIAAVRGTRNHYMKITKCTLDPDTLIISMECVTEDLGIYRLTAPPSLSDLTSGTFTPGTIVQVVPPVLAVLDTAALRLSDLQNPGVYVAGCASDQDGFWDGETVQESTDNSIFNSVQTLFVEATIGEAQTTLGDCARWTVWDEVNTVDVLMTNGALASASRDDLVANFANLAWLSSGELFQFTTATLLSANLYRLSGLLRGRFGTESFIGIGSGGGNEQFVLISESTMQDVDYSVSEIGATRYWQGINDAPNNTGFSGVQTLTMTTRRMLPFAPYFIKGTRASNNLTITGLRRMRWRSTPLWSPQETDTPVTMEIDVMNGASVVRTLTSTLTGAGSGITNASSFTAYYAAADQVTDFGSPQASLTMHAYEKNAVVGRGYGKTATI